eukprot:NODE_1466_length_1003_cov_0.594027.p1 type:complete len:127 gc:universal NODE_1466_length_1003_cov_0.594027:572-952(+)
MDSFDRQHSTRNKSRLSGGGSKPILGDSEINIYNEIIDKRRLKIRVTRNMICKIARTVADSKGIEGFVASEKFLSKFLKRHKLSLRRASSRQTLNDEEIVKRSVLYYRYLDYTKLLANQSSLKLMN